LVEEGEEEEAAEAAALSNEADLKRGVCRVAVCPGFACLYVQY